MNPSEGVTDYLGASLAARISGLARSAAWPWMRLAVCSYPLVSVANLPPSDFARLPCPALVGAGGLGSRVGAAYCTAHTNSRQSPRCRGFRLWCAILQAGSSRLLTRFRPVPLFALHQRRTLCSLVQSTVASGLRKLCTTFVSRPCGWWPLALLARSHTLGTTRSVPRCAD